MWFVHFPLLDTVGLVVCTEYWEDGRMPKDTFDGQLVVLNQLAALALRILRCMQAKSDMWSREIAADSWEQRIESFWRMDFDHADDGVAKSEEKDMECQKERGRLENSFLLAASVSKSSYFYAVETVTP